MEGDDFLSEDVSNDVQRYEKMLRNKTNEYFDTESLEGIIDFYIQTNNIKKAFEVVNYSLGLYALHSEFLLQKSEIYILTEQFENALSECVYHRDFKSARRDGVHLGQDHRRAEEPCGGYGGCA